MLAPWLLPALVAAALYLCCPLAAARDEVSEKSYVPLGDYDPAYTNYYHPQQPTQLTHQPQANYYGNQYSAGYQDGGYGSHGSSYSHPPPPPPNSYGGGGGYGSSYGSSYGYEHGSSYTHGGGAGSGYALYGDHHYASTGYADRFRCTSFKFTESYGQTGFVYTTVHVPDLDSISVCMWVLVPYDVTDGHYVVGGYTGPDGVAGYGYESHGDLNDCRFIFTYTVDDSYRIDGYQIYGAEIALACVGNLHVFVGNNIPRPTGVAINDGYWHHICVTYAAGEHAPGYGGDHAGYHQTYTPPHGDGYGTPHGDGYGASHPPHGYGGSSHPPHPPHDDYHDPFHTTHAYGYSNSYASYHGSYHPRYPPGYWCLIVDGWPKAGSCLGPKGAHYAPSPLSVAPMEYKNYIRGYGTMIIGGSCSNPAYCLIDHALTPATLGSVRSLIGNVALFHVHSQVVDPYIVKTMALYCYNLCGDVVNWFNYWTFQLSVGLNVKYQDSYGPPCCKHNCECYELEKQATGLAGYYKHTQHHGYDHGHGYGYEQGYSSYPPAPAPHYGPPDVYAWSGDSEKKEKDAAAPQKKSRGSPSGKRGGG